VAEQGTAADDCCVPTVPDAGHASVAIGHRRGPGTRSSSPREASQAPHFASVARFQIARGAPFRATQVYGHVAPQNIAATDPLGELPRRAAWPCIVIPVGPV
jgi:hypothetical protein